MGVFATATRGEALIKAHTHMQSVVPPFHHTESGGFSHRALPTDGAEELGVVWSVQHIKQVWASHKKKHVLKHMWFSPVCS